jgi:hypothetical protein
MMADDKIISRHDLSAFRLYPGQQQAAAGALYGEPVRFQDIQDGPVSRVVL